MNKILWCVLVFCCGCLELFCRLAFVIDRIWQCLVFALLPESFITFAHLAVGNQSGYVGLLQLMNVIFAVVTGIGRDEGVLGADAVGGSDHRQ